jgi:hypothetical protein
MNAKQQYQTGLYKEFNCTQPSLSVSIPWFRYSTSFLVSASIPSNFPSILLIEDKAELFIIYETI